MVEVHRRGGMGRAEITGWRKTRCYMVVPGRRKTGTIEILGRNACVEDPILRKLTALRQAVDLDAPPLAQV